MCTEKRCSSTVVGWAAELNMKISSDTKLTARRIAVHARWALHSYYSLCPYAPDRSGRLLLAGADIENGLAEVFVLSAEGEVIERFGTQPPSTSFWHTGFWQSWSPDARCVYYQRGEGRRVVTVKRELRSGSELELPGEIEGMPMSGEPGYSCLHSLLYAAGYGDNENRYRSDRAVVPFQRRDLHGIFKQSFASQSSELALSTEAILDIHPERDVLLREDRALKQRLGSSDGLTLMTYCVRWNAQGSRFLFYFGNHCVDRRRGEPRLAYVFTADRNLKDIRLALDISFNRRGVHWAWQPDGERLIGYGPAPNASNQQCLAEVRFDGSGFRKLSDHASGGHPSVCPSNDDLIVTDELASTEGCGNVVFLSRKTGECLCVVPMAKYRGATYPLGRSPDRVCHHPVFSPDGERVLCVHLPGRNAELIELMVS